MDRNEILDRAMDLEGPDVQRAAWIAKNYGNYFSNANITSIIKYIRYRRAEHKYSDPGSLPKSYNGGVPNGTPRPKKEDKKKESKPATNSKIHRTVAIYDMHIPYHDEDKVKAVTKFVLDAKPDLLVLGGGIGGAPVALV